MQDTHLLKIIHGLGNEILRISLEAWTSMMQCFLEVHHLVPQICLWLNALHACIPEVLDLEFNITKCGFNFLSTTFC